MCKCKKQQSELLPEYHTLNNSKGNYELYPEIKFELFSELAGPPNASRGSRDYVKWVQASLNKVLSLNLGVDGVMGAMTRSAVRSFQRQKGLNADGIIGGTTEAALKTALAGLPVQSTIPVPPLPAILPSPIEATRQMVDPRKVSCLNSPYREAILRRIGTNDPIAVLEAASQRAVTMLSNTITELTRIKERVRVGDPIGWPLISDILAWSLKTRMLMRVEDRTAWTGTGTRNAGLIIRWLTNIRNLIASRDLWFTCLAENSMCSRGVWAWVWNQDFPAPDRNFHRIHFCLPFWYPGGADPTTNLEYQAQIIIHEVSHIYYNTSDRGMGPGRAECIAQFIADANNSPTRPGFIGQCGTAGPTL